MPPLNTQTIEIPLGVGLDTKLDSRIVQPGSLLNVENGEFTKIGAVAKRAGSAALSRSILGGGSFSAGTALINSKERLLAINETSGAPPRLYQYNKQSDRWSSAGQVYPGAIRAKRLARTSTVVVSSNCVAYANGYAMYAWEDGLGTKIYHTLIDTSTGTEVWVSSIAGTAFSAPKLVSSGNYIFLVLGDPPNIKLYALDTSTIPSLSSFNSSVATLQTNFSQLGIAAFDVGSHGGGTGVLAYRTTTPSVKVQRFTVAGSIGSSLTVVESVDTFSSIGVIVTAALDTFVVYRQLTTRDVRCFAATSLVASRFAAVTVETDVSSSNFSTYYCGVESSTPNTVQLIYGASLTTGGLEFERTRKALISSAGAVSGIGIAVYGMVPQSTPFLRNGSTYVVTRYRSPEANTVTQGQQILFLIDITNSTSTTAAVAGRILPGEVPVFTDVPSTPVLQSGDKMLFATLGEFSSDAVVGGSGMVALDLPVSVEFDFGARPRFAQLRDAVFVTGMVGHVIPPGDTPVSAGFQLGPEIIAAAQAGGGSLADGSYSITAVYARIDTNGEMAFSLPSETKVVVTSGGSKKINVTVSSPKCDLANYILYYMTDVNGSVFYEIARTTSPVASADSYTVALSAVVTTTRTIYTQGGALENAAPPSMLSVVVKGSRLYGITHDAKLYYTKEFVEGLAASFSPDFMVKQLLQDGGSSYAIEEMDGMLVVFGEHSIQVLNGEGLNLAGNVDTLSEPRALPTDTGSLAGTPLVVTDLGVFFKSRKGLCLLTRSLTVDVDIGNPVNAYNAYDLVSAVVVPEKNQVRFGHSDVGALVYDMNASRAMGKHAWSVFTNFEQVGSIFWDERYCRLTSTGMVLKDRADNELHADQSTSGNDVPYQMKVETPWLRLAGLQGFQRVLTASILGSQKSATWDLLASVYYDYATNTPLYTWSESLSALAYDEAPLQVRERLGHKCEAIKFLFTTDASGELAPDDTAATATFTGLALELGGLGGIFRTSRDRTV